MAKYKRGTSLYDFCIKENLFWILEQYDYERNAPLTPKDISKSSDKKVYFKYECGHSCKQRIADKTGKKSRGCPECLNRGNVGRSLLDEYPYYAQMFMSEMNGTTPDLVTRHNGSSYWWKCPRCNSLFKGKVSDVVLGKRVCGECSNKKRSFPEYCLAYYLQFVDDKRIIDHNIEGYKFDFYLPKFDLLIEYDGYPWHNRKVAMDNDSIKDALALKHHKQLLRIRDKRLTPNPNLSSKLWITEYDERFSFLSQLEEKLYELFNISNIILDIDVKRDISKIKNFQFELEQKNSLLVCIPNLYDYLADDDRNGKPEFVCNSSEKIRFWLRDPVHQELKWSMTAHRLFTKKSPYTQWIIMCLKIIEKYPELKAQVVQYGNNIREQSVFELTCKCGKTFTKTYAQLMGKRKMEMCHSCLTEYRVSNLTKR